MILPGFWVAYRRLLGGIAYTSPAVCPLIAHVFA